MRTLTVKELEALSKPGRHNCGDGLYLEIDKQRARRWLFRYQFRGHRTFLGLGSYNPKTNGLKSAREKTVVYLAMIAKGIDPKEHKDTQKLETSAKRIEKAAAEKLAKNTFEKIARDWYQNKRHEWTGKHSSQNITTLENYAFPKIGPKPISECTVHDTLSVLRPIWTEKTETARRVMGRMSQVFAYAKSLGLLHGENPATWKGNLDAVLASPNKLLAKKAHEDPYGGHFKSMNYADVKAFLAELKTRPAISARALEFMLYTLARTGSIQSARWSDIDLEKKVWNIPPAKMKSRKAFQIPLVDQALDLLTSLRKVSEWVFPSPNDFQRHISSDAQRMLLQDRMNRTDATPHGFRASFRTWAAEKALDPAIAELCLSHSVGTALERAYQRSALFDRRRKMMEEWVDFLTTANELGEPKW